MKFVKRFKTETDYNSYMGGDRLILPNISLIDEVSEMSEEDSGVRFNSLKITPEYEYVDLGLPSGLKWAKCNIGAEKESDYGLYFQWGDIVGYRGGETGKVFAWNTYKYCNGSKSTLTKYNTNSSYGIVDNLTTLEPSDDSASVNMGGSWRMPSEEEYNELLNNTTNTWTTVNGVNGRLFTGNNGNTLFLPASGFSVVNVVSSVGYGGYYWSSTLDSSTPYESWHLNFSSDDFTVENYRRDPGFSVRGVID